MSKLAVVAIGGNSLIEDSTKPEVRNQWDAVRLTTNYIVDLVAQGWNLVVTHGNGPQVGFIMRRSEIAAEEVHTVPLDLIVADTQGSIGYMIQQTLENEFRRRGLPQRSVAVITQTLVDRSDPAFQNPTKPIGGYISPEKADRFREEGWTIVEDAGRGLRRVVASPKPVSIIEQPQLDLLVEQGFVVVANGGGGIPVVFNQKGELRGTYAVVDKDRATALMASSMKADLFLISTGVPQVAINFNTPEQQGIDTMTVAEAKQYIAEKQFAEGSMLPKIESVIYFLENGGKEAIITNPENIPLAIRGQSGTRIIP